MPFRTKTVSPGSAASIAALSILFARFKYGSSANLSFYCTFNSLCEIPKEYNNILTDQECALSKFERQERIASNEGNLLVAAPTGWGKTTLALIRMIKLKPVKVFYILPTITAIKDFYDTFTKILDETYIGEYFYFVDVELLERREAEEEGLFDIYRYFINITTIDQLLFTTLQIGKYHVRRFNLKKLSSNFRRIPFTDSTNVSLYQVFLKEFI